MSKIDDLFMNSTMSYYYYEGQEKKDLVDYEKRKKNTLAVRKWRSKQRKEEQRIREESVFYDREVPVLKRKARKLAKELADLMRAKKNNTKDFSLEQQFLKRENEVLKKELLILRQGSKASSELLMELTQQQNLYFLYMQLSKNYHFLLRETLRIANDPAIMQLPSIDMTIKPLTRKLLLRSITSLKDNYSLPSDFFSFMMERDFMNFHSKNVEMRTNLGKRSTGCFWCRTDVIDFDIPKEDFLRVATRFIELPWYEKIFAVLLREHQSVDTVIDLSKQQEFNSKLGKDTMKQEYSVVPVQDDVMKAFYLKITTKLQLRQQLFQKIKTDKEKVESEALLVTLLPRRESSLENLDIKGFRILDGVYFTEGSSPGKTNIFLIYDFTFPEREILTHEKSSEEDLDAAELQKYNFFRALRRKCVTIDHLVALFQVVLIGWKYIHEKHI